MGRDGVGEGAWFHFSAAVKHADQATLTSPSSCDQRKKFGVETERHNNDRDHDNIKIRAASVRRTTAST